MARWSITFGSRYNHEPHPADERINGQSFVVVEADTELAARWEAVRLFGFAWAFLYERDTLDFQRQVREYGLVEVAIEKED